MERNTILILTGLLANAVFCYGYPLNFYPQNPVPTMRASPFDGQLNYPGFEIPNNQESLMRQEYRDPRSVFMRNNAQYEPTVFDQAYPYTQAVFQPQNDFLNPAAYGGSNSMTRNLGTRGVHLQEPIVNLQNDFFNPAAYSGINPMTRNLGTRGVNEPIMNLQPSPFVYNAGSFQPTMDMQYYNIRPNMRAMPRAVREMSSDDDESAEDFSENQESGVEHESKAATSEKFSKVNEKRESLKSGDTVPTMVLHPAIQQKTQNLQPEMDSTYGMGEQYPGAMFMNRYADGSNYYWSPCRQIDEYNTNFREESAPKSISKRLSVDLLKEDNTETFADTGLEDKELGRIKKEAKNHEAEEMKKDEDTQENKERTEEPNITEKALV